MALETNKLVESKKSSKKRKISLQDDNAPVSKEAKVEEPVVEDALKKTKETASEAENATAQPESAKRQHKRKRHYYNAIRTQMEFYFGDANLSKDRFLRKLIMDNPYVPLEVFMTFNKIKTLAKSVAEIAKSLSNSQLLELDETGLKVRRKSALPEERNVDEKTLYVESLPPHATHEWVREIFQRFGPISYVSLPKFVKSRKIKEFGFVEFENEKSVRKAVKAFEQFDGVLKVQEADPAELASVQSYIKEQNEEIAVECKTHKAAEAVEKRKHKKTKNSEELIPSAKRIKKSDAEESNVESEGTATATSAEETADEKAEHKIVTENVEEKKKVRKKKKKTKSLKERQRNAGLAEEATYFELKILPKLDWKRLRNKYLNLQRQKVGELKRKLWLERQQQQQQALGEHAANEHEESEAKKCKTSGKLQAGMNMNFYGAGDDESSTVKGAKEAKHNPALERAPLFSYEPGLIVEIALLEPCTNLKELKANMRQYTTVKYVDVKEGSMQAHLRLESASAAEEFIQRVNSAEYVCKVLTGDAESAYWQKIEQDREAKLNKQVNLPKKRGREKIKKIISQHMRFGDED